MKLNKKQVAIIWIGMTVLIPVVYLALIAASSLRHREVFWQSAKPTEEALIQRATLVQERRALFNKLGIFSFGLLSLTGLLVYLNNEKKA